MNMMANPVVKILKVDTICHESSEIASTFHLRIKAELGIVGGPTVTLIEAEKRIIIDTGFDYEWIATTENCKSNARDLVCGSGSAGLSAAVCAARNGADVLLLERHSFLRGESAAAFQNWFGEPSDILTGFTSEYAKSLN
jgi:hypothetical protein